MATAKPTAKSDTGHTRKAYQGIRQMLFHNEIAPGQKIAYRDLAERLGMSQTPVIQALKWLEFQGLVRHERHRGYYTEPISTQEVEEIYEFREQIELALLARTMQNMDKTAIKMLESSLDAHLKASREVYLHDRLLKDMEFHLTLASLSGNQVQQQILRLLFDRLYLKYGGNILFSTSMDKADMAHKELFAHIREGNLAGAKTVLSKHIRNVKKHVLNGLERLTREKVKTGF
ncbi:GntR family transcriptional regulator [Desulfosarcina ovata]|uniref:Transcriptional regulator n=1 Tax=Desulfosarcina ovata subsp. ovata TaxID=2752305 RepID=A0A5K8ABC2_9BACT|nr:GntR family transcriptional regulator [Desulfosarcina ovata]BBO89942.1 transcriptional regulator [Desulfosarcina ovata subsp. ovata]